MSRKRQDPPDERLDPVRWRRPGSGTMLRLASVAVLLTTAAAVVWIRPADCVPLETAPSPSGPSPRPSSASSGETATARPIPAGNVGVPVRLADPTALSVVRPGHRVDLLPVAGERDRTAPVASAALVLEVTGTDGPVGGLLVALRPEEARQTIAASGRGFAVVIRPG